MSFVSYARNLEDVMLWRVLRQAGPCFYIDVGAGDPVRNSLTCALYRQGWRGINVEPVPGHARELRKERPADITLVVGAGSAPGSAILYDVAASQGTGYDANRAERLRKAGHQVKQRDTEIATLDHICAEHADGPIHVLAIDTNGDEHAVLQGLDLQRWRPWLLLLSVRHQSAPPPWRERLQAAGYTLAYQDGHNHFYLASEHAELATLLRTPPHADDDFVLCEGHAYAHPVSDLLERLEAAETTATLSVQKMQETLIWAEARGREQEESVVLLDELRMRTANAETEREHAQTAQAHAETRLRELDQHLQETLAHVGHLEYRLNGTLASLSWRITKPLRVLNRYAKAIRHEMRLLSVALRRALGQLLRLGRRLSGAATRRPRNLLGRVLRAVMIRGVNFIVSRPKLSFFIRSQIARHPRLTTLLRGAVLRTKKNDGPPQHMSMPIDLAHLPPPAQHVLDHLRRSLHDARHP
jgi:FkbM family methyltransferase